MKKKQLDLKKKLVLSKETIANLTPAQQANLAGGVQTNTYCTVLGGCASGNTECNTHIPCVNSKANCQPVASAHCPTKAFCGGGPTELCVTP